MSPQAIIFYILAAIVLFFAVMTVTSRMLFRSAMYLLFSLVAVAGIYFLMEMDFVAALQIIIYVGGIVVLIIFSIFLTHQSGQKLPVDGKGRIVKSAILSLTGMGISLFVILTSVFKPSNQTVLEPSVKNIGRLLLDYSLSGYVFPFEVISVLLLASLIGGIVIAIK